MGRSLWGGSSGLIYINVSLQVVGASYCDYPCVSFSRYLSREHLGMAMKGP